MSQSAKKKLAPETDAPEEEIPLVRPKRHKRRHKKIPLIAKIAVITALLAAALYIVLRLLPMPLKEHTFTVDGEYSTKRHFTVKVPESFVNVKDDYYSGQFKDPADDRAWLMIDAGTGSSRADDSKKQLGEARTAIVRGESALSEVQRVCDFVISVSDVTGDNVPVWEVSISPTQEYDYRYDMRAYVTDVSCKATEDWNGKEYLGVDTIKTEKGSYTPARKERDAHIKKGDEFIGSYFVVERNEESGSKLYVSVGIGAPANHPIQKVREQIFDSLTLTVTKD